jgi:hypothetical protein
MVTAMKPPLFVIEGADVSAYVSLEALEIHLEAIDVKNNIYVVYDSEGRLLTLGTVAKKNPILFGLFCIEVEHVVVLSVETEPKHQIALRDRLIKNLSHSKKQEAAVYSQMSLDETVQKYIELNGYVAAGKVDKKK